MNNHNLVLTGYVQVFNFIYVKFVVCEVSLTLLTLGDLT